MGKVKEHLTRAHSNGKKDVKSLLRFREMQTKNVNCEIPIYTTLYGEKKKGEDINSDRHSEQVKPLCIAGTL